jgi:hypothetical protein
MDSPQQSKDVEDKLRDLIPWLMKLKDTATLTSVNGNHEEGERREQLRRCVQHFRRLVDPSQPTRRALEDIESRSQALLTKGKVARILDKTQDSQAVIKLIEGLRQAIFIYQVGTIGGRWDRAEVTCLDSYRSSNR